MAAEDHLSAFQFTTDHPEATLLPIHKVTPDFDVHNSPGGVVVGDAGWTVGEIKADLHKTRNLEYPVEVGRRAKNDPAIVALNGNHRLQALRELGATHVPVVNHAFAQHPVRGIKRDTSYD